MLGDCKQLGLRRGREKGPGRCPLSFPARVVFARKCVSVGDVPWLRVS